jgi:glycosyltransferase involved in cell wall biosynthesis
MRTAAFTIIAKNYLPFARVLMDSLMQWAPELIRIVVLVDRVDGYFDPGEENFDLVLSADLGLPKSPWFHFKYTTLELSTGVKPYAIEFLLHRYKLDKLIYFDPDIKVYAPLNRLHQMLDHHNIILTPHLTDPLDDNLKPSELDILRSGSYNLGFIALRACDEVTCFLQWWQAKLYDHCVVDLPRGLFVDQRWIDLVPGMFADVAILRDPGYNVAYWNLKHRRVYWDGQTYRVRKRQLYFFHFSGFDPDNPYDFSRHQNRFRLPDLGDVRSLVGDYRQDLLTHGYSKCKSWPLAYNQFTNGVPIPDMARPVHHEYPELLESVQDPFAEDGFQAFVKVWNAPLVDRNGDQPGITRLAYRVYRARADVQAAMPDVFGAHRIRFLNWVLSSARTEHTIPDVFLTPVWEVVRAAEEHELRARESARENHAAAVTAQAELSEQLRDGVHHESLWFRFEESGQLSSLNEMIETGSAGLRLTRLARSIYESRPDLQRYMPDPCGKDGVKFVVWALTYGRKEYCLSESCLKPLRIQWNAVLSLLPTWRLRMWYRAVLLGMAASVACRAKLQRWTSMVRFARASRFLKRHVAGRTTPSGRGFENNEFQAERPNRQALPAPVPSACGVNLIGYLRSEMGVGESARLAAMAMRSSGIDVSLKSVDGDGPYRLKDFRLGPEAPCLSHAFNVIHVNADQTPIVFRDLEPVVYENKYNIGYWAWELEEFPERWLSSFDYYDEIWTPSKFSQDAIARRSPIPVLRMPHAIRVDQVGHLDRSALGLPPSGFLFLAIFDMMSVFERKNPLAAVKAFVHAFGRSGDCHLVLKINHADQRADYMDRLRLTIEDYPISIIDRTIGRDEVNALIQHCDCLVSLHRSEGFGLTMAEAMYLGKPVIATAYSGNMDFTKPDNAFLVDYRLTSVPRGCLPYEEGELWADPDLVMAAAQFKLVFENPELRLARAAAGRDFVHRFLSFETVGAQIRKRLELISLHARSKIRRTDEDLTRDQALVKHAARP